MYTLTRYDIISEGKLIFRDYDAQHETERHYYEQSAILGVDKVKLFAYIDEVKYEFQKGKGYVKCIQ